MNQLNHLAIIMDGNGRWAKKRALLRTGGHEVGAQVVQRVCEFCIKEKIPNLTLYAFSTENWKRPKSEVEFLMKLLAKFLVDKKESFLANGINFKAVGDIAKFSDDLKSKIYDLQNFTQNCANLNLNLAINYGARDEIVRACREISRSGSEFSESEISARLDTARSGDVDLLIRTGGEKRISNFLLWQASYAEFAFSDTLWPEFSNAELSQIISEFKNKNRRFGGL
ncbi:MULTISPECIES: polyprenyl diphosphate synthase [unclassified Campylobacter]|uniref:polyprenyl diphosphate synthase n=1 Tax=unclassified Campylobacter TaxID=2593542 RepID=UPI0022E9C201|nr:MULTISPECIES: polyprenyl diphosphate synthase [unclassified Campylobacter]MDA3053846.1 polyprenyl diphosphate synthase [Campylobacter sp. VBCF_07 NA4]MDA3060265.1 polyprenyl diphosphate synthase [Campylobacter sp. VBCF_02 NA5]MDA3069781.1 polyprenyl diphosphate synthase [Campylobacter sp. VBCF_08 NA3]WBR54891.1 polyprenyl diphosphate synthase [Campylobacter sp. VBCF_01 NA2]